MRRCRTLSNAQLQTGRRITSEVEIPPAGLAQVFHENATEAFRNFAPITYYGGNIDKAYWPVGQDSNVSTQELIQNIQITNAASTATLAADASNMAEIEFMRITCSALAAARTLDISIADGTNTVPIWSSLGANVASGADFAIWPVDVSTYYAGAVALIGTQISITAASYLEMDSSDIAGAETMDLYVHWKAKRVGGLE